MISPQYQTSSLKALHSLDIIFAPKHTAFAFLAMYARLLLASLHYNENSDRLQAITKDGTPRYSIRFPKFKKGEYSVRKEKTSPTYGYTEALIEMLLREYEGDQRSQKKIPFRISGKPCQARSLLPSRNPARKQQLKNLFHGLHSNKTE
ncbi:uncharacterized protein LOC141864464 [Acropora palmata]|uniref:uncharacterized protein LOC141864464 n=1 Tax=Acropora palmata TaxID=6131 RepID=UPI003DA1B80C